MRRGFQFGTKTVSFLRLLKTCRGVSFCENVFLPTKICAWQQPKVVSKSELTTVLSGYNFSQRLRRICLSDKAFRSLASGTFTKTAELESMDIDVSTGEFLQWQDLRSNTTTFIFLKLF